MFPYKILMGNLGYMRGINGALSQHLRYAHRHFYCSGAVQEKSLKLLSELIAQHDPDLCCFVEIDKGSSDSRHFNQLERLVNAKYPFSDIENKYGEGSRLRTFGLTKGKSNAFLSKRALPFQKIYFEHGVKRLIYRMQLAHDLTLFFAHFSLKEKVRVQQLRHARRLMDETPGESILLGDFNILTGFRELEPLTGDGSITLLNDADTPTFFFHKRKLVLDLCLATPGIAKRATLHVVPQPYSDHAALLLEIAA